MKGLLYYIIYTFIAGRRQARDCYRGCEMRNFYSYVIGRGRIPYSQSCHRHYFEPFSCVERYNDLFWHLLGRELDTSNYFSSSRA